MKHWRLDDIEWDCFDPTQIDPALLVVAKSGAVLESNGQTYALYVRDVFRDDTALLDATDRWADDEVLHGTALGRWVMLADPGWSYEAASERFRESIKQPPEPDRTARGVYSAELISRCIVETGTAFIYTALFQATTEPVLKQICRHLAADEYRHYKMFYDHLRRYLVREDVGHLRRLWIALGRIRDSEDDVLAYAYHCGNEPPDLAYDHQRCSAASLAHLFGCYRFAHVERGTGMVLKTVGLPPRGRLSELAARLAWLLLQRRRRAFERRLHAA